MKFRFSTLSAMALVLSITSAAAAQYSDEYTGRFYVSASGMWVDQGDADFDVDDLFNDGEWRFDEGWGVAVAVGQELFESPFRLEFEYAYRQADAESITAPIFGPDPIEADAELQTQSFMLNGYIDVKLGDGPLGVYAGAGAGVALTRLDQDSIGGMEWDFDDTATSFAYQAMAGVTFEIDDNMEIFGGVRYFDALEAEVVDIEIDTDSLNFEVGMRFFF